MYKFKRYCPHCGIGELKSDKDIYCSDYCKKWSTKQYEDKPTEERRKRILLLVAAYLYEYKPDETIMSDGEFDRLGREINPNQPTGNKVMDKFFKDKDIDGTGRIFTGGFLLDMPDREFEKLEVFASNVYSIMWVNRIKNEIIT